MISIYSIQYLFHSIELQIQLSRSIRNERSCKMYYTTGKHTAQSLKMKRKFELSNNVEMLVC